MRDAHEQIVQLQPFHVQNWVVISGDGMAAELSYTFSYSYLGAVAPTGREVFRNFFSPAGDESDKNFVIVTTFFNDLSDPTRDEIVYLYDMAGNSLGRWKINFVQSYYVGSVGSASRAKFKTELHVIRLQS